MLPIGTRRNRDHGALVLRGVILQGERRPYADVEVYFDRRLIGRANQSAFASSGDMAHTSDIIIGIAGKLAVKLAREMEN